MHTSAEPQSERLTDYERAVHYYTIPRVTSPVTNGLVAAYCLCLLETVAALIFGYLTERPVWTQWGAITLAGIVIFGIVAFFIRALINDIHARRALAATEGVPDAGDDAGSLPDPFADHVLLRYPEDTPSSACYITGNDGEARYKVEQAHGRRTWELHEPSGGEPISIHVDGWGGSFSLSQRAPARVSVHRSGQEPIRIRRRFTIKSPIVEIPPPGDGGVPVTVRGGALFEGEKMVGRIYHVRGYNYLDIEKRSLHDGILGYFVTMV